MIVYHGTREENIDTIVENGLRKSELLSCRYGAGVYGTTSYDRAINFLRGDGTVFSFEVEEREIKVFHLNELEKAVGTGTSLFYIIDDWVKENDVKGILVRYDNERDEVVIYDTSLIKKLRLETRKKREEVRVRWI